jgi:hypothetical protein
MVLSALSREGGGDALPDPAGATVDHYMLVIEKWC